MRRAVVCGLTLAVLVAVPAPGASPCLADTSGPVAGATGGVNVHVPATGKVTWCSAAVIAENKDVADGTGYPVKSAGGGVNGGTAVSNALSIHRLLTLVGVNPDTVSVTHIARPDGAWAVLRTPDLADPSSSFEDGLLPIVWIDGSAPWLNVTTRYVRPQRDADEANAADRVQADDGDALDLFVQSGPLLDVTATATPGQVRAGDTVAFSASASGASGPYTYSWTFGDGDQDAGATPAHTFTTPGRYRVLVTARTDQDAGGAADPLTVQVGPAPAASGPTAQTGGGGSTDPQAPVFGPTGETGSQGAKPPKRPNTTGGATGTTGATDSAPPRGFPTGTRGFAPDPRSSARRSPLPERRCGRSGSVGVGTGGGSSDAAGSACDPRRRQPLRATVSGATTPASGAGGATGAGSASHGSDRAAVARRRAAAARRARHNVNAVSPKLVPVAGRLLGTVRPIPRAQVRRQLAVRTVSLTQPARAAGAPAARQPGAPGVAGVVAGGSVLVLLLFAGAEAERRARRRSLPTIA